MTAINKRGGPSVAEETVKLPEEFFLSTEDTILGFDLSGNPMVGQTIFLGTFLEPDKTYLHLLLHFTEIPKQKNEGRKEVWMDGWMDGRKQAVNEGREEEGKERKLGKGKKGKK